MEESEKALINNNLFSLVGLTTCGTDFLAYLQSSNVLSNDEVERIAVRETKMDKAMLLYNLLCKRTNGYIALLEALNLTNQNGVKKILLDITVEELGKIQIELFGNNQRLNTLLCNDEIERVQQNLCKNITFEECLAIRKNVIKKDEVVRLMSSKIPSLPSLYIPRFLSRRLAINTAVFEKNCPDVFVFHGISRLQLRHFAGNHIIYDTVGQLRCTPITQKFILLDKFQHWEIFISKVTVPIHLMKFEPETETFVLVATQGGTEAIQEYLDHRDNASQKLVSEDDLVKSVFSGSTRGVAICESPGMGKSLLLASVAKKVSEMYPDVHVAYIQLRDLKVTNFAPKDSYKMLLQHISSSVLSCTILQALLLPWKMRFALFFDGLDEVVEENLEFVVDFLGHLSKTLPTSKLFITSRPVFRGKIEKVVGSIAYDIQTFNCETPINYLKTVWSDRHDKVSSDDYFSYARICVKQFATLLGETESKIAGVPLLCKMIADVFADEAVLYVESKGTVQDEELCISSNTFADVYSMYMNRQLGSNQCGFVCIRHPVTQNISDQCRIKNFHLRHALQILCPKFFQKIAHQFEDFKNFSLTQMLRPSVIKQRDTADNPSFEFVHRTFAEYLVAEFFASVLTFNIQGTINDIVLQELIHIRDTGISYFLNFLIGEHLAKSFSISHTPSMWPATNHVYESLLHCARYNYGAILEVFLRTQASYTTKKFLPRKLEEYSINKQAVFDILECALRYCTVNTVKCLEEYFVRCFNYNFIQECSKVERFRSMIRYALSQAKHDIAFLLIDKMSLFYEGLLKDCLENSFFDEDAEIDKRLDIAQFIVAQYSDRTKGFKLLDELLETVFLPSVHTKAIILLNFFINKNPMFNNVESKYLSLKSLDATSLKNFCDLTAALCGDNSQLSMWRTSHFKNNYWYLLEFFHAHAPVFFSEIITKPFIQAIEEGNVNVVYMLLERSSNFLDMLFTKTLKPSIYSIVRNWKCFKSSTYLFDKSKIKLLLELKLEIGPCNILHLAAQTEDWKVFHRVVEVVGKYSDHFLKRMVCTCKNTSIQTKIAALPHDICGFFEWTSKWGDTPLHFVCRYVDLPLETLELFLVCGRPSLSQASVNINAKNEFGQTPLYYALNYNRSLKFVKHLISCGADWKTTDNAYKYNPAHLCAKNQMLEHLKFFVGLGVDVNERSSDGDNALQLSLKPDPFRLLGSAKVPFKVVKFLIDSGADLRNQNNVGETALDIAIAQKYPKEYFAVLKPT